MDISSAKEHLKQVKEFESFEILGREDGDNNYNFIFRSRDQKYVLRKKKQVSEDQSLRNERNILEFLEFKDVVNVPRSVFYDPGKELHVITFVGEEDVRLGQLNEQEIDLWTEKLLEINSLKFDDYRTYCEERNFEYKEPEHPLQKLESLREDLNSVSAETELDNLLERIIGDLEEKLGSGDGSEAFLTHSDLSNSTRRTEQDFYLIDWEFAGFNLNRFSDLGIVLAHSQPSEKQKNRIRRSYRKKLSKSENFNEELDNAKRIRHVFNIVWCLKRISRSGDEDEVERYRSYVERQRKMLEQMSKS